MKLRHSSAVGIIPAVVATLIAAPSLAADTGGSDETLSEVVVVGVSPLPGAEVDADKVPAPVQTATAADIARTGSVDLTEFMKRSLGSVYVNEMQNNPLQPDINYRGYTASPLQGTPEGMSVYMDGVRLNEPFGDTVNWDLIPLAAISTITLMPGSNPVFGLNTLGGALSIQTKDGWSNPGLAAQLNYGSHSQRQAEAEYGGSSSDGFSWFLTANKFKDDGWREFSPSDDGQVFGKVGWKDEDTKATLSASWAKSNLTGNGLQDPNLLEQDYKSVYSIPDNTRNNAKLVELAVQHNFIPGLVGSGNLFYRNNDYVGFNGDINDDVAGNNLAKLSANDIATLTAADWPGYTGQTTDTGAFPQWRCIAAILSVGHLKPGTVAGEAGSNYGEPAEKCTGIDTTGRIAMHQIGISAQLAWTTGGDPLRNTLVGGFALAKSGAHFTQFAELGVLNEQRGVTLIDCPAGNSYCDPYVDGTEISDSGDPDDNRVDLQDHTNTRGVFVSDVLSVGKVADLTLSGRYDYSKVNNYDYLTPEPGDDSLTAVNTFHHFNPAFGAVAHIAPWLDGYAGWDQSSRAPSAIELGCDGPDSNCRLPNAMSGDPPGALKQVITQTVELGVRGSAGPVVHWSAGVFRGDTRDDILFQFTSVSGYGYFTNFGKTRRQGIELSVDGGVGPVHAGANFTKLDATYQSAVTVEADGNSTATAGTNADGDDVGYIQIVPGDHIPLVPRNQFKVWANWDVLHSLSVDADLQYIGRSYARGNENNEHQPDGVNFVGPGYSPAYTVTNLGVTFRPVDSLKLSMQVDNLFDRHYYTAAWLQGTNFPNGPGQFVNDSGVNATFYAPGAPRAFWFGARYTFNADAK